MQVANFILPVSSMVFACFFLIFSLLLPEAKEGIGPGGWPTTVLALILLLGAALFIRIYKEEKMKKARVAELPVTSGGEEEKADAEPAYPNRHLIVAGIIFLYFFIMQYVGMMLSTPLFIAAMGKTLGMRGWVKLTVIALLSTVFIIGLFGVLLTLSMPRGVGVFRTISEVFY